MTQVSREKVEEAIKSYIDPYMDSDLASAKSIKDIVVDGDSVKIAIQLGFPAGDYVDTLKQAINKQLESIGVNNPQIDITTVIEAHEVQKGVQSVNGVKNIIAVASGKGGVGKSTTAVNLALALSADGANVGILDADIYGPSQPRMLGAQGARPDTGDGKTMEPVNSYHLQSMSIGYLVEEDTPMIWRGPMVTQALEQLLKDTNWKDLDYLIVDLPPGTGDTQLTLAQKIPVSGAIIVTTPQDIALLDARKGLKMFEKVEVPVLGIVENMSIHICSNCGHEEYIFAQGGGEKLAEEEHVDFLGSLPLDLSIRKSTDEGKPTVVAEPESRISEIYKDISRRATAKLALQKKNYQDKFPNIVIN